MRGRARGSDPRLIEGDNDLRWPAARGNLIELRRLRAEGRQNLQERSEN